MDSMMLWIGKYIRMDTCEDVCTKPIHLYTYTIVHVYASVDIHICTYVYISTCLYICTCMDMDILVCTRVYMYVVC